MSRAREVGDLGSVVTVDDGNVGIGTNAPVGLLDVVSSGSGLIRMRSSTGAGAVGFQAQNSDTGTAATDGVFFGIDGSEQAYVYNYENTPLLFGTNNTERLRITSAGEVLVAGTTAIQNAVALTISNGNSGANEPASLNLFRNDGGIASGNVFGEINFYGNDTTSNTPTKHAYIQATASGTHAAGDNPTDIVFGTTANNTGTVAEVARFDKYLRMASGTNGIQFNGDTAAANALDDYEEGTWTPVFIPQTGSFTSVSYDPVRSGSYTKIGDTVYVQGMIRTDGITVGTATGAVSVSGLPFTAINANPRPCFCIGYVGAFAGDMPSEGLGTAGLNYFELLYRTTPNGGSLTLQVSDLSTGGNANYVIFEGFYKV